MKNSGDKGINMRRFRFVRVLKILLFVVALTVIAGYVVMRLWNWLTPPLFGWHLITFWQALGILLLSKILFGGFRGGPHRPGGHWRNRMAKRWAAMTPEEREKFRASMGGRCGWSAPDAAESKT